MRLIRDLVLLAVAAVVSYFVLLHGPEPAPAVPEGTPPTPVELTLEPSVEAPAETTEEPPPPQPPPDPVARTEETPAEEAPEPAAPEVTAPASPRPDPESGVPDGVEDGRDAPEESQAEPAEPAAPTAPDRSERLREEILGLAASVELRHEAEEELSGRARHGFRTVFLCAAGDQLAIARWFEEAVVLVPRAGLDPTRPHHFRLELRDRPRVVRVDEAAPLARYRQYRDLFAFSYGTLPGPLRDLRRSVFNRGDVYLFAALLPPSEWAVVIARRRSALQVYNAGRPASPQAIEGVRRFTMRYVPLQGGGFDIRVTQILFADGTHWTHDRKR